MRTIVIYHSEDFDGIFCREIAKKFLGERDVTFIGWNYGDPEPTVDKNDQLYILDLSIDSLMSHPKLIWIDHHKTAMDKYLGDGSWTLTGDRQAYCIDGVAACRLAWQWFSGFVNSFGNDIPQKEDYLARRVSEPWAVRLAGEYDILDKRDPNAELFQHGLRSCDLTTHWKLLLEYDELQTSGDVGYWIKINPDGTIPNPAVGLLLDNGRIVQYARENSDAAAIQKFGYDLEFEGLNFLACNWGATGFNSLAFKAGIKPHHDGLLGYRLTGKHWSVSLYHAPGKEHHDLSKIATRYGGGGHKGACGFTVPILYGARILTM